MSVYIFLKTKFNSITDKGRGQKHIFSGGNKREWPASWLGSTLAWARTLQAAQCEDHPEWTTLLGPVRGNCGTERLYDLLMIHSMSLWKTQRWNIF